MKINKIFFVLTVVFFSSSIAVFGQTENSTENGANRFAVLFQVNGFLRFSGFGGASFSGEYFFTEKSGLRIGVSTAYSNSDLSLTTFNSDTLQYSESGNGDRTKIGFSAIFVRNLVRKNNFSFFVGAGISFSYSKVNSTTTATTATNRYYYLHNVFGVPIVAGVEWFVKKNISISLEYGISLNYQKEEKTKTGISGMDGIKETSVIKGYELDPQSIKMGLAVYF